MNPYYRYYINIPTGALLPAYPIYSFIPSGDHPVSPGTPGHVGHFNYNSPLLRVGPDTSIITVRFSVGPGGQRMYEFSLLYRASVVFKMIF